MFEEFADVLSWWNKREENERAWYVPVSDLQARDMDLDLANPHSPSDLSRLEPPLVIRTLEETIQALQSHIDSLKQTYSQVPPNVKNYSPVHLAKSLDLRKEFIKIDDSQEYQLVTVQLHARGIRPRERKFGRDIKTKKQQVLQPYDFVVAEIDAKMGGFGIVPPELSGAIVSSHYFTYTINTNMVNIDFLDWFLKSGLPESWIQPFVKGSTNYAAIRPNHFPLLKLRLPPLPVQERFAATLLALGAAVGKFDQDLDLLTKELTSLMPAVLLDAFTHEE